MTKELPKAEKDGDGWVIRKRCADCHQDLSLRCPEEPSSVILKFARLINLCERCKLAEELAVSLAAQRKREAA